MIRKYDLQGNLLWDKEIDHGGGNDRGIDIIEDDNGNYLVLADVEVNGQNDVYLFSINGSTGSTIWEEAVSEDGHFSENAVSIKSSLDGQVYITYDVNGQAVTHSYNLEEVSYPADEPHSKGTLYISNNGQIKGENDESIGEIKYYSFGQFPDYYFADDYFSALVSDSGQVQRINFNFFESNETHVGQVEEYERETHFNYYINDEKYEQQGTFEALAYPGIYENVDAVISSNSEGFKLTYTLESGADINDIRLKIEGSSGTGLSGGNLVISTITEAISWMEPFSSYNLGGEMADDDCIEYNYQGGILSFTNTCGELTYPYVIHVKVGAGSSYTVSGIDNMDWSTFWGGNYDEIGNDIEADTAGNIYVAGMASSDAGIPSGGGVTAQQIGGKRKGLVLKFDKDGDVKWGSLVEPDSSTRAAVIKGVGLYDNISHQSAPGQEVHVVGEYTGVLNPDIEPFSGVPSGAWQQTSFTQASNTTGPVRDLFIASFESVNGTQLLRSPFGGSKREMVFTMDIAPNGLMYFAGSTRGGSSASASSQDPPSGYTFPVRDPGDGSYFEATHPDPGRDRAFVSAIDLNTYKLAYSSVITKDASSSTLPYQAIYSIFAADGGAFCGEDTSKNGRLGFFDPASQKFTSNIDSHPYAEWTDRQLFSSVVKADSGFVFFGLKKGPSTTLLSDTTQHRYRNTQGRAFMLRIVGNKVEWDTYFGKDSLRSTASMNSWRLNLKDDPYFIPQPGWRQALGGRGKVTYSPEVSSLFFGGSILEPEPVESKDVPGFFFQNVVQGLGHSQGKPEHFLASFSHNEHGVADKFTWGTMYGQNGRAEHFSDLVTYTVGGETYLVVLGTINANNGSTTSDIEKYPLANLGGPAWYQKNNPGGFGHFHCLAITRFNVTDLTNHISLPEHRIDPNSPWTVYPNPAGDVFSIISDSGDPLHKVKVYDINGRCVLEQNDPQDYQAQIDVSGLSPGVYLVNINERYNQKLVIR